MKKNGHILNQITFAADLPGEVMPTVPIIEIAGCNRVLIERHCGVTEYSCCKICVKVVYGSISIVGKKLELTRMSKEQLIITGVVQSVTLIK